jgi:hypothetical protein
LSKIDAMLRGFPCAEKNYRDIVVVACAQGWVFIDVYFGKASAEFLE